MTCDMETFCRLNFLWQYFLKIRYKNCHIEYLNGKMVSHLQMDFFDISTFAIIEETSLEEKGDILQ